MKTFIAAATLAFATSAGASTISIHGDAYTVTMEGERPTFRRPGPDMFEGGKGMAGEVRVTPRARPCAPMPVCNAAPILAQKVITTVWKKEETLLDQGTVTLRGQTVDRFNWDGFSTSDLSFDKDTLEEFTFVDEDHIHISEDCGCEDVTPPPVPLPASLGMFGLALAGLFGLKRRTA